MRARADARTWAGCAEMFPKPARENGRDGGRLGRPTGLIQSWRDSLNRISIATFALIAFALLGAWLHQVRPATAAAYPTYEFRLVTAGISPNELIQTLNTNGTQGYRAVGLVCLSANVNQYGGTPCVAEILMERQRH
jgi:hypothetical protein